MLITDFSNSTKKFIAISKLIHHKNSSDSIVVKPDSIVNKHADKTYISNRLVAYLRKHYTGEFFIADIGGGNGQIVKEIGQAFSLDKDHLYCVETDMPWAEPYTFSNADAVQYVFWDNHTIPTIPPNSVAVVIIMVTLHHMTDETMENLFHNLERLTKPNSLLIIKEHDCLTREDKYAIDWEHHLYHLAETPLQTVENIEDYKKHYIDNFKTKKWFDSLIEGHGYTAIAEFNRFFQTDKDARNPTNLYWKVYRRSEFIR